MKTREFWKCLKWQNEGIGEKERERKYKRILALRDLPGDPWLRLCANTAEAMGSISGQGTATIWL